MAAEANIDSLVTVVEYNLLHHKDSTDKIYSHYNKLLKTLHDDEKFKLLVEYGKEAYDFTILRGKPEDKEALNGFAYLIGYGYERMGSFAEALYYYGIVIDSQYKTVNVNRINAICQTSSIYQMLGNYQKAFDYQMQALKLYELSGNTAGMGRSNYILGTIFYYQNRYQQALEQYEKALVLCEETKVQHLLYSCYGALGSTHEELGNMQQSIYYNRKALRLAREIKYDSGIAYSLDNIGTGYLKSGNCEKAEDYVNESIILKQSLNDVGGIMGSKFSLIEIYESCGKVDEAFVLLEDALKMSKELGSKSRELEAYQFLARYHENQNRPSLALDFTKKYIALKDTILNEKTVEEMGQSKQRYEMELKESEISMLKAENEILNVSQENQRLYVFIYAGASILFVLLFILLSVWFFSRLSMQRKVNKMLKTNNDLLNQKNEEIDIKNKQLEHSNEDLQQFAYVASHDLKEPLRMIHSYTTLLERRYNDQLDESGKEFMHFIVDAVDRMKILLDDLLDYSRSGNQEMPDKMVDVGDMMLIVSSNLGKQIEENKGNLIVRTENMPAIRAHNSQLMQLLQNLVSNGMKFRGERDPVIVVDCEKKNNQFVFSVKDNGIGISKNNLEKVFEMFRRLHTREEYPGTGIGLATCKRIVNNMGGDIWVESTEGEGSTFFFSVPCPAETLVMA